jgi:RND family efflux transporter MFP subunit
VALAVRQGNLDTAVPRLLALLSVTAVFLPSFFMEGTARALFVPLSLAVVFAMTSSYLLSSTFVPVAAAVLLRPHAVGPGHAAGGLAHAVRDGFASLTRSLVAMRWVLVPTALVGCAATAWLVGRGLGIEIFPRVDAGRFQLRIEAPTGTRIERTEKIVRRVLEVVDEETGGGAVDISVGYAGLIPSSYPINAIYQWTAGPEEAVLRVALKPEAGIDAGRLTVRLRERLVAEMPGVSFSFEPADIVSEVMSFGSPTPVDVAVSGPSFDDTKKHAEAIRRQLLGVPTLRDVRYAQALDYPAVRVAIDRRRAGASDVTAEQVARSLVAATSSSRFVVPNYWPDPKTGIGYQVQVEIPYEAMRSMDDIATLPVDRVDGDPAKRAAGGVLLRDVADISRGTMPGQFDRYNMKRVVSLTANVVGEDLGRAADRVGRAVRAAGEPPKGVKVDLRGQIAPLWEILRGLSIGLGVSLAVILLVLTAAFQSLRLSIVALAAAPAVLAGVVLALRLTGTTLNLQSFMGAIMALGVSTANAILFVSFAERERKAGLPASEAAVVAARDRLRPILMTSIAMIAGMIPLALGGGEGGEQSAPLGRAVIGGLLASTGATLLLLPAVFAVVMARVGRDTASLDPFDPESARFVGDGGGLEVPAPLVAAVRASVVLLLVLMTTGCGLQMPADSGTAASARPAPAAAGAGEKREEAVATVTVSAPVRATLRRTSLQPGHVEAFESTAVHAKLAGFVERVEVDIGDTVKAGDVLARIAVPELVAERDQKAAMVERAVAEVRRAESNRKVAAADRRAADARAAEAAAAIARADAEVQRRQYELKRTEQLVQESAVTAAVGDEARSALAAAQASRAEAVAQERSASALIAQADAVIERAAADVDAARSAVELAKADAARVGALLEYATIRAPFDGAVRSRLVHPGHLTLAGGAGEPLFVVDRKDKLRVVIAVPELQAAFVDVGDPVEIRPQAAPGGMVGGTISRTAGSLDDATRTLRVEVDVEHAAAAGDAAPKMARLRPGLYVMTTVVAETRPDALAVPAAAVVREPGGRAFCYVFDGQAARRRDVVTGLEEGGLVEIVSGLEGSEKIVAAGSASLSDGQTVRANQ